MLLVCGCELSSCLVLVFVPLRLSLCLRDENMLICRCSEELVRLVCRVEGVKARVAILIAGNLFVIAPIHGSNGRVASKVLE